MILSALNDYYQRLLDDPDSGVSESGYRYEQISFIIVLSSDGYVVDVNDLREISGKTNRPKQLKVPLTERTSGVRPKFLWDNTSYALGASLRSKRSEKEHEAFKQLHREELSGNPDPGLKALVMFLEWWTPDQLETNLNFAKHIDSIIDTNVAFRLDGENCYLHERPAAVDLWGSKQGVSNEGLNGMCLVTGQITAIADLHPAIRGVKDAQSSGAYIVSFNKDSFRSYGKTSGDNAPISDQAAFAYTTALNHLLRRSEQNRQRLEIGDTTVVFWAQASEAASVTDAEDIFAALLGGETDEQATGRLRGILEQIRQGCPLHQLSETLDPDARIFVLGLAPNASRLSIRFWESRTLADFAERLAEHYRDLQLLPQAWKRAPSPKYLALQTARVYGDNSKPKAEDVPPLLAGELTRAILTGSRYPRSVLAAIIMRFRADGQISPLRVALCKAVLTRDARLREQQGTSSNKGEPPVSLDLDNKDPGYLLGRLFSTLENLQRAALGAQVNATIRDRYYGAASATPASIFPVLLRNAQNHLGKVRKEKPGLAINIEKDIGQIVDLLSASFPRSLLIEAQGRFAIGYYHQTQARFAGKDGQDAGDTASEGETI